MWGRVINPLWCLKAPGPATKKWIFQFRTKFGFRNHLQTFWPRQLVKSELSLGLIEIQWPNVIIANGLYCIRPGRKPQPKFPKSTECQHAEMDADAEVAIWMCHVLDVR